MVCLARKNSPATPYEDNATCIGQLTRSNVTEQSVFDETSTHGLQDNSDIKFHEFVQWLYGGLVYEVITGFNIWEVGSQHTMHQFGDLNWCVQ